MNSDAKRWFYPAQVYAQFTSGDEKPTRLDKQDDNVAENQECTLKERDSQTIQIFESGEMTVAPDYAQVLVLCSSVKDTVEEVKASVNKRAEYILQTFRSHNISKNCYTIDRLLRRHESKYTLKVEISVRFANFLKCQEVSNYLVEKLGDTVEITRPSLHFLPGKLEGLRRQSCVLAVQNARVKALEIANSLNQSLGQAKQIYEQSTEEYTGEPEARKSDRMETFQELVKSATVTVVTKVSVTFELKTKTKKRMK